MRRATNVAVDTEPAAPGGDRRTSAIVGVLSVCGTVVALQQTLVIPLLPDLPEILHTSQDNVGWLVTATLLTGSVSTPIVTRLADMFGKRRMILACLIAMILGSVIAAAGGSFAAVVVGRAVQGVAVAQIPVGISIMRDELPREKVPGAVALMSATLGIGGAIGLPLSGLIYEHLGWQAIFWTAGGAGLALAVAVLVVVPESAIRTRGRFDYAGAVVLAIALTSLLLAITKGRSWGWTSERTLLLLLVSALVFAAWIPYESRVSRPLVDIRTSTTRPVLLTNIASFFVGFSMYANMLSTTQQLQIPKISGYGFGLSVLSAGLCMVPSGLVMIALSRVSAWITRTFGARITLIVGSLILAVGYVARVLLTAAVWQLVIGAAIVSMGTALAYAAMPTLIMRSVPITETASANGVNSLLRSVGTSVSSAAVIALLASATVTVGGLTLPSLQAFRGVFWLAALAALIAALIAAALPPRSAPVGGAITSAPDPAAGRRHPGEIVVRGYVLDPEGLPIRQAVVTVLRLDGQPADWSRADNAGEYSVVLPGAGRYLVVYSADGWAPRSEILTFSDAATRQHVRLSEPLLLDGCVSSAGEVLDGALVSLTSPSGELVDSVHTHADGTYAMPLPPSGRYILTVVTPDAQSTRSRQLLVIATQSNTVDIDLSVDEIVKIKRRLPAAMRRR